MIRRKSGGRLLRQHKEEEDVNPMDGTANLADAMLVLAVGMMLALVMNWNVDLAKVVDVEELNANTISEDQIEEVEHDRALQEKGVVYEDPETGKYYIRVED